MSSRCMFDDLTRKTRQQARTHAHTRTRLTHTHTRSSRGVCARACHAIGYPIYGERDKTQETGRDQANETERDKIKREREREQKRERIGKKEGMREGCQDLVFCFCCYFNLSVCTWPDLTLSSCYFSSCPRLRTHHRYQYRHVCTCDKEYRIRKTHRDR